MYSLNEIIKILSHCNTMEEIMMVCNRLMFLKRFGQKTKDLQAIALKRVTEI